MAGVVENMSYLELPDGGRMELFGSGGGAVLAERLSATVGEDALAGPDPPKSCCVRAGMRGCRWCWAVLETPAAVALAGIAGKLASVPRGLKGMSLGLQPR